MICIGYAADRKAMKPFEVVLAALVVIKTESLEKVLSALCANHKSMFEKTLEITK